MKKYLAPISGALIILAIVGSVFGAMLWKHNSAKYYTLKNLTYERVEPNHEWKSHDDVTFVTADGQHIKYICPQWVYQSMVYGTKYDVTIIEGDFSLPDTKVSRVVPAS